MDPSENTARSLTSMLEMSSTVIGHEANYQVMLHNALVKVFGNRVYREYRDERVGRGGIDVVVCDRKSRGCSQAFELKGGAYGDRNALVGTFDKSGFCSDFERLEKLQADGVESWMICVDATSLGRSFSDEKLERVIENARNRGVGLAYHAHGVNHAILLNQSGERVTVDIRPYSSSNQRYNRVSQHLSRDAIRVALHDYRREFLNEADVVAYLYRYLVEKVGFSVARLSLETYFGISPSLKRMQWRPDLCIFDPEVNGNFNLYSKGDRNKSNDPLKLATLRSIIEVKGGIASVKKADATLVAEYRSDLDKLRKWRQILFDEKEKRGFGITETACIFLAVDVRKSAVDSQQISYLGDIGNKSDISFIYLHLPI